jgi:hypothetical protein
LYCFLLIIVWLVCLFGFWLFVFQIFVFTLICVLNFYFETEKRRNSIRKLKIEKQNKKNQK